MMGKSPLDMAQYKKVFGTCRIPHEKRDKLSFNDTKHITVIHNNHVSVIIFNLNVERFMHNQILQFKSKTICLVIKIIALIMFIIDYHNAI